MSFRAFLIDNAAPSEVLEYCKQLHRLTPGETEVVSYIVKGVFQKEMALLRRVSIKTISTQKRSAFLKMQISSDVECIHYIYFLKNQLAHSASVPFPSPPRVLSLW